ncbi:hypothetical protein [Salininema proteolyticum]|uniref:Uncharacterized protein n=1 Tax=Salininema proteolyticum TaxID=1607685 RepID=A0ABV8TXI9_9ACTN
MSTPPIVKDRIYGGPILGRFTIVPQEYIVSLEPGDAGKLRVFECAAQRSGATPRLVLTVARPDIGEPGLSWRTKAELPEGLKDDIVAQSLYVYRRSVVDCNG